MKERGKYVLVIPARNERDTLRHVVMLALRYISDIIIVDDGSSDRMIETIVDLPVTIYQNSERIGKAGSLWKGIQAGLGRNADFILTMDGDGQHRAEDIPAMMKLSQENPRCIVMGSRLENVAAAPKLRRFGNLVADVFLSWACGQRIIDSQSGFRVYPRSLFSETNIPVDLNRGFVFESEILIDGATLGYGSVSLSIPMIYSEGARPSHFRPVVDTYRITMMITLNLISRLAYPVGLYRAFLRPTIQRISRLQRAHLIPLSASFLIVLGTAGVSLMWYLGIVIHKARHLTGDLGNDGPIVVLGRLLLNGRVSADFSRRLEKAKDIWEMAMFRRILILGGKCIADRKTEAEEGRRYLLQRGVPGKSIFVEEASHNTLDNLQGAKLRLVGWGAKRPLLISNRYHLPRCHYIANGIGLKHDLMPAEDRLTLDINIAFNLLKEAFFLLWFRVGQLWAVLRCGKDGSEET